jgi:hypothetical protein
MKGRRRTAILLTLLASLAGCGDEDGETYGFVATLGNDTTSVERITRVGDRIISDAVGRSPVVVRRQWEGELAPDGSLRRWTMHTHVPNAPDGARDLHHAGEFGADVVTVMRREGQDSTRRSFRPRYAVTVPWNAFVYGTWEVLLDAARGRPDTARIGLYFFEGWAEGGFGHARVRGLGGDSVAISSTGLSGAGVAHIDPAGRLVSYSGEGTTYRQQVRRVERVPDLDEIARRFAEEESARGFQTALSVRDTARGRAGGADVMVEYSRPLARGRVLLGGLIPYGRVWRTGANAATHVTFSAPVMVAGTPVDSGTWTLWTLPSEEGVQLIINRETGQWGTGYRAEHDMARVPMGVGTPPTPVEAFTIRVEDGGGAPDQAGALVMEWGTFRWSVSITPPASPSG